MILHFSKKKNPLKLCFFLPLIAFLRRSIPVESNFFCMNCTKHCSIDQSTSFDLYSQIFSSSKTGTKTMKKTTTVKSCFNIVLKLSLLDHPVKFKFVWIFRKFLDRNLTGLDSTKLEQISN